jgi:hypothetical protein
MELSTNWKFQVSMEGGANADEGSGVAYAVRQFL